MKYVQHNIPSPNPTYPFNFSNFQGGFNNRDSYTEIADNQSPATLNIDLFKEAGVIQSRGGSEVYVGNGTRVIDNFYIREEVLHSFTSDGKFEVGGVEVGTTALNGVEYTDFNNFLMYLDGENIRYYGIFPQANSTYITIIGTPVTGKTVMKLVSTTAGYTPLDTTHLIGKTIYNYTLGTVEYQPCTNEVNDEYKGVSFPIFTSTVLINRNDRVYMAGGSGNDKYTIAISEIDNPFYFPVSVQLGLEPNGDEVRGLFNFHDVTIVGRGNDIYAIYGSTNRTDLGVGVYNIKRINTHTGFRNRKCHCMVNNYMFYLGNDGNVYGMYTPQTDVQQLTTSIINRVVDLRGRGINATEVELSSATCLFDGNYFWLNVGQYTLIYSYLYQAWQVWSFINEGNVWNDERVWNDEETWIDGGAGSYNNSHFINRMFKYDNKVYLACVDGYVFTYNFEKEVDYNGGTVLQYHYTKQYDMGYRSRQKVWKSINAVTYYYEAIRSTINVDIHVDFTALDGVFDILSSVPRWGEAVWGSSKFSAVEIGNSTPILVNGRGRLIQFVFGNNNNGERFKVFEINGEYELRGFR